MSESNTTNTATASGVMTPVHTMASMYGVPSGVPSGGGQDVSADLDTLVPLHLLPTLLGEVAANTTRSTRSSNSTATRSQAADYEYQAGRRMFAEPRLLGVLVPDEVGVRLKAGTGPGRHAFHREFKDEPFPLKRGAVVNFDVRFDRGFEWGCRGKVGGLFVGPGNADGGEHSKNGASLRLMWDAGGGAYAYVYVPKGSEQHQPRPLDESRRKGVEVFKEPFKRALVGSNWHRVQLGVKLNTFTKNKPNADGELLLSIDDKQRVLKNVVWRLRDDLAVEQFVLSFFHGGPCRATRTSQAAVRYVNVYSW